MRQKKTKGKAKRVIAIILVIAIVLTGGALYFFKSPKSPWFRWRYPEKYSNYVEKYAAQYGVDKNLIYAIIRTESGFDPNAVSEADAIGLMQMTEDTFDWIETKTGDTDVTYDDLYDPETGIRYGACLLHQLLVHYDGDTRSVIAAYHAGIGSVDSWISQTKYSADGKTLDDIPKQDTAYYVYKVDKAIGIYNTVYGS